MLGCIYASSHCVPIILFFALLIPTKQIWAQENNKAQRLTDEFQELMLNGEKNRALVDRAAVLLSVEETSLGQSSDPSLIKSWYLQCFDREQGLYRYDDSREGISESLGLQFRQQTRTLVIQDGSAFEFYGSDLVAEPIALDSTADKEHEDRQLVKPPVRFDIWDLPFSTLATFKSRSSLITYHPDSRSATTLVSRKVKSIEDKLKHVFVTLVSSEKWQIYQQGP